MRCRPGLAFAAFALGWTLSAHPGVAQLDRPSTPLPEAVHDFFTHLAAGNLEGVLETYAESPTIQIRGERFEGAETARRILAPIAAEFRQPGARLQWRLETDGGDLLLVSWAGATAERYYEDLYAQFELVDGKIGRHTLEPAYRRFPTRGSWPDSIVDLDGTALFFASDHFHGTELWASDGTPEGTRLVADLAPGVHHAVTTEWVRFGDRLYFSFCHDPSGNHLGCSEASGLWRTDGTPEGTRQVHPVRASVTAGETAAALDEVFLFVGEDDRHGAELWQSDGTREGTRLVRDLHPGPEGSRLDELFPAGDLVFFGAHDGTTARLWRSDGTPEGTIPLARLRGGYDWNHWAFAELDGVVLLNGDDGHHGGELWRTDGTPEGTRLVADLRPGPKGSQLFEITVLDGIGYFSADDGDEREVFRTDGTPEGTYRLDANPAGASAPDEMTVSGGRILFSGTDRRRGAELWAIEPDGRPRFVVDIDRGSKSSRPNLIVDLDGVAIFAAGDAEHGVELWRSDGTRKGTWRIRDLRPGPESARPRELVRVGDLVFFNANDGRHGTELWRTDGTPEGTILLGDLDPAPEEYRPLPHDDPATRANDVAKPE